MFKNQAQMHELLLLIFVWPCVVLWSCFVTQYNDAISCSLLCEFPATGGAVTSWSIRSLKLLRYISAMDCFVLACECVFILFILYYIVEEVLEVIESFVLFCFWRHRCRLLFLGVCVWSGASPSWVQGQSPGRGLGEVAWSRSPCISGQFEKVLVITCICKFIRRIYFRCCSLPLSFLLVAVTVFLNFFWLHSQFTPVSPRKSAPMFGGGRWNSFVHFLMSFEATKWCYIIVKWLARMTVIPIHIAWYH